MILVKIYYQVLKQSYIIASPICSSSRASTDSENDLQRDPTPPRKVWKLHYFCSFYVLAPQHYVEEDTDDIEIVSAESGLSGRQYVTIQDPTYDEHDFEDLKVIFNEETVEPLKLMREKLHREEMEVSGEQWKSLDTIIWGVSIVECSFATPPFDLDLELLQSQIYSLNQQYMAFRLKVLHRFQQLLLLQSN